LYRSPYVTAVCDEFGLGFSRFARQRRKRRASRALDGKVRTSRAAFSRHPTSIVGSLIHPPIRITQPACSARDVSRCITTKQLENLKMIVENEKVDCADSLSFGIHRTKVWREKMAAKHPFDPRNLRAAECLGKLAIDAKDLSDNDFALLKPYCGWASELWR
jgi:hypothetical protein